MSKQDRQSGEDQPKPKRATRKWSMESMTAAYKAVKSGSMSLSKASRKFGVPRMTLADCVKGRIQLNAQWGHKPVLSADEEQALVVYIEYMANRGFLLTIGLIIGFAWCIAKTNGKAHAFKKTGPTKQWWNGFKKRHPHLRLRRPDTLDRGRATMGNVWSLREYFSILKEVMDANDFHSNPHLVFNCDEAAINLNESAGQKVVVPCNQKHTHTQFRVLTTLKMTFLRTLEKGENAGEQHVLLFPKCFPPLKENCQFFSQFSLLLQKLKFEHV